MNANDRAQLIAGLLEQHASGPGAASILLKKVRELIQPGTERETLEAAQCVLEERTEYVESVLRKG